jgi:hypothetical protein
VHIGRMHPSRESTTKQIKQANNVYIRDLQSMPPVYACSYV